MGSGFLLRFLLLCFLWYKWTINCNVYVRPRNKTGPERSKRADYVKRPKPPPIKLGAPRVVTPFRYGPGYHHNKGCVFTLREQAQLRFSDINFLNTYITPISSLWPYPTTFRCKLKYTVLFEFQSVPRNTIFFYLEEPCRRLPIAAKLISAVGQAVRRNLPTKSWQLSLNRS